MSVVYDTPYNRDIRQKLLDIDRAYIDHSRQQRVGTQEILTRDPLIKGGRLRTVFKALSGGSAVIDPEYVASLTGDGAEMMDKSKLSGGYMGDAVRPPVPDMYISGDDPRFEGMGMSGGSSRQIGGALEEKEEDLARDRSMGEKFRVSMHRGGANIKGVPTPAHLEGGANLAGVPTPAHLEGGILKDTYGRDIGDPLYGFSPGIVGLGKKKVIKMKPADFMKEHKDIVGLLGSTGKELSKEAKSQLSEMKAQQKKLKKMKGGDLADALAVPRTPLTGYGKEEKEKMVGGFWQYLLPMVPSILGQVLGKGRKMSKAEMSKMEKAGLHEKLRGGFDLSSILSLAPLIMGLGKKKRLTKADMEKLKGSGIFGTIGSLADSLGGIIGLGKGGEKPKIFYANGMSGGAKSSAELSDGLIEKSQMPSKVGGRKMTECQQMPAVVGGGKKTARAALVKKIMKERGVSLIEASKIVKREGMKY